MNFLLQKARRYPVSCIIVLLIWVLSFIDVPETPLDDVRLIDKWTHIAMYGGLCLAVWAEYLRRHTALNRAHLLLFAWLMPAVMGGAIELLQAYCTAGRRSGDPMDALANAVGATLAAVIGILWAAYLAKRRRDCGEDESCGSGSRP